MANDVTHENQAIKRQKLDCGKARQILDVKNRVLPHKSRPGLIGGKNMLSSVSKGHKEVKVVNCPNVKEISLDFARQEKDSTDFVIMMDSLGRTCPRLRNIHIASIRLCNEAVFALTSANLRGLRMLSLVVCIKSDSVIPDIYNLMMRSARQQREANALCISVDNGHK